MLNSSIGPVINTKKFSKAASMQKKPMTPGMSMYSLQMMNQNKMPMPMGMRPDMMNGMKAPDPNMALNPQQPSMNPMKIENLSLQSGKKVNPQFMMNKGMASSPSLSQTSNPGEKTDLRFQMPTNSINMPGQQPLSNLAPINTASTPLKANDKELVKPSEITTTTLKIGSHRFHKDCKILTKIIFGKKQFIWEITESGSASKGDDDSKSSKRRFELKFSDIEKIEINTEASSMQIDSKEKPAEYKEHNSQLKKSTQWIKEATYETESEFGEDESKNGLSVIIATYPKDSLTKNQPGKMSHLDKLRRCEITLFVDGKAQDSVPSTPLKTPNTVGFGQDSIHPFSSQAPGFNFNQMLQMKKEMSFPDLGLHSHNSIPFNTKDSFYGDGLNLYKDPSERMQEEMSQQEAEEDDEEKEFPPLTKEKKIEAKKFESQLKAMKNEDKIDFIIDTIKPKKFGINMQSKKIYKCPLYKCSFQKNALSHLKNHLQHKHKRLLDMGFNIDETGGFTWKPELTDFAIMVAKIYPNFVKNIVKEAKKMP